MRYVLRIITSFLFFVALGCAPSAPIETSSFASFAAPTFAGSPQTIAFIANYNDPITVNGECSTLSTSLKISTDAGVTWVDASGSDLNCADGNFSITIADCSSLGFTISSPLTEQRTLLIHSEGILGVSDSATIRVQLGVGFSPGLAGIRSGAGVMTGTQFKINAKSGSTHSLNTLVGTNFKIKLKKDF